MFKPGQMVMLIGTDGFMPPLGAIGEIVAFDDGDYDVLFPKHPCPVPPGITWCAPPTWLMPLGGDEINHKDSEALELKA